MIENETIPPSTLYKADDPSKPAAISYPQVAQLWSYLRREVSRSSTEKVRRFRHEQKRIVVLVPGEVRCVQSVLENAPSRYLLVGTCQERKSWRRSCPHYFCVQLRHHIPAAHGSRASTRRVGGVREMVAVMAKCFSSINNRFTRNVSLVLSVAIYTYIDIERDSSISAPVFKRARDGTSVATYMLITSGVCSQHPVELRGSIRTGRSQHFVLRERGPSNAAPVHHPTNKLHLLATLKKWKLENDHIIFSAGIAGE